MEVPGTESRSFQRRRRLAQVSNVMSENAEDMNQWLRFCFARMAQSVRVGELDTAELSEMVEGLQVVRVLISHLSHPTAASTESL